MAAMEMGKDPIVLLKHRPVLDRYLKKEESQLSGFSFSNVFIWQDFFRFDLRVIDGCLCVFAQNSIGTFLYLPPLGEHVTREVLKRCFRVMEKFNHGSGVTRVENVGLKQCRLFPREEYTFFNRGHEYCYYKKDIAALRGNKYKSKRSSYNQFIRQHKPRYIPFEETMADECVDLYTRWANDRKRRCSDDIYVQMIEESAKAHRLVLRFTRQLGLTGRVVVVDGKVRAYSFGYALSPEMFCVLLEITDTRLKGLAVYLFREFCRDQALNSYSFINVMDDFEMDNIRQVKMSFHPSVLLPVYTVTKKTHLRVNITGS